MTVRQLIPPILNETSMDCNACGFRFRKISLILFFDLGIYYSMRLEVLLRITNRHPVL